MLRINSYFKYVDFDLLKFGLIDISNMSILILVSKEIFMKHLPPVRPKLVPKCSEFIEIWHICYFKYADLDFYVKNDFY